MRTITKNKFVHSDYDIQQTFDAGIVLKWFEVKSIKTWHINITDSIVRIIHNQAVITNMDVPLYKKTSADMVPWYQPKGRRILLMHRNEIGKLTLQTRKNGLTLVPIELYEDHKHRIKLKLGLGKLRKKIEKKQILKEKDIDRQARRDIRSLR